MKYWTLTIHGDSDVLHNGKPFEHKSYNFKKWDVERFIEVINSYKFSAREGKEAWLEHFEDYRKDIIVYLNNHKNINLEDCDIEFCSGGNQYYSILQHYIPTKWDD